MLTIEAPIRLVSEANVREHWARKARRARDQRMTIAVMLRYHGLDCAWPIRVTLTRIAPRPLDGDNLQRACKALRDGVADWLGVDDRDPRVEWAYAQERGKPRQYAVRVGVQSLERARRGEDS